jgi:hypothetical protein
MSPKPVLGFVAALLVAAMASPLFAYTVFLKDGSSIEAKEIHRIEGDRVIITLPNGTETFIDRDEVDLERTREFNKNNIDGALLLEGGETRGLPVQQPKENNTLGHLIASGEAKTRTRDPIRRSTSQVQSGPSRSPAGYLDFGGLPRRAYGDAAILSDLRSYFTSQGLETQVFSGTRNAHPLLEVTTNSEEAVFKTLQVVAQALPQLRDRYASRVEAIELLMRTDRGSAAGQFVITPELADKLNSGETEVAALFVREVQF